MGTWSSAAFYLAFPSSSPERIFRREKRNQETRWFCRGLVAAVHASVKQRRVAAAAWIGRRGDRAARMGIGGPVTGEETEDDNSTGAIDIHE